MTRIQHALALLPVVAALSACGSSGTAPSGGNPTGPGGGGNPTTTTYVGAVASPAATGSFKATITTPASNKVLAASAARAGIGPAGTTVHPLSGSSMTITITLLNGSTLTLSGSLNNGAFTVTDNATPPDMCTGNVASVLNASCSFFGFSNIPVVGVLAVEGAEGALATYCGFETPTSTNTTPEATVFLGIAGTNSFLARVASSNNVLSGYLGHTATSTTIADTLVGSTTDFFSGTYTTGTASGTETNSGTAVGSWSATSPCTLTPATMSPSGTVAFTASVNAAPAPQTITVTPASVGPVTAVVSANAPWLAANVSGNAITLSAAAQTMPTTAGNPLTGTVAVYAQFAQNAPLMITVDYTVTGGQSSACTITTSPTLPALTVGTVADVLLTTTGDCPTTGSDSWTVTNGTLPDGLAIPLGGTLPEIYGAPKTSGVYGGFTVNLINSAAPGVAVASLAFNGGTVQPQGGCEIGPVPEPNGTVGVLYAQGFVASTACTSASDNSSLWAWSISTGAPPGLTFDNPIVGVKDVGLTGTPTRAGTFTFTVTFANTNQVNGGNEAFVTQTYTMVIAPAPSSSRVAATTSARPPR